MTRPTEAGYGQRKELRRGGKAEGGDCDEDDGEGATRTTNNCGSICLSTCLRNCGRAN